MKTEKSVCVYTGLVRISCIFFQKSVWRTVENFLNTMWDLFKMLRKQTTIFLVYDLWPHVRINTEVLHTEKEIFRKKYVRPIHAL